MIRPHRDRVFYPALAIAISATGFSGFAFTYFGPIVGGTYPPAGAALHVHGWSFFLWYLLLPFQALLIGRRRRALHSALGRASAALVLVMIATGVLVLSVRVDEAVRQGAPRVWLLYGPLILSNLVLFLGFYVAGLRMALANRMEAHKRLILVGSAIGVGAGFFRLVLVVSGHPLSLPIGVLACGLFIVAGAVYDRLSRGSVHPAYWIGLVAMLAVEVPLLPQVSQANVTWVNDGLAALGDRIGFLYRPG